MATKAVRAPFRSSSALVAIVVPCENRSSVAAPTARAAATTDSSWRAAVGTLAILVSLGLFVAAIEEIAEAERHTRRWPSYVLAAFWAVTGVLALAWPDVTLWALAFVVGVGLLAVGAAAIIFAIQYHRQLPMWGLALVDGVLGVVLGVMALVWPEATVLVLAILLGLRVLFRGIMTIMFGLGLRRLSRMPVA